MLEVQKYLNEKKIILGSEKAAIEALVAEYAIVPTFHSSLPLVILNYDQIESQKKPQIVRDCRGLVLNLTNFDLVAKAFNRFFNWGEMIEEADAFDFSNCAVYEKVDGSLVPIYCYEGEVCINTRGSFANGQLEGFEGTWKEAIESALTSENKKAISLLFGECQNLTLVFEFCSLYNKVVRTYNKPQLFLLGVFDGLKELHWDKVDELAKTIGVQRPIRYEFKSIQQIEKFIREISEKDSTYEGVVIQDWKGNRWKLKNPNYLALHRLKGNGNIFLYKNLVPFVLSGESGELLSVYREAKERYDFVEKTVNDAFEILCKTFTENREIEDQKTFALSIKGKTPFTSILFTLKKKLGKDATVADLKAAWRESTDSIIKVLFD